MKNLFPIFLLFIVYGCAWDVLSDKMLKQCTFPEINVVFPNASNPLQVQLSLSGTTTDVTSLTWTITNSNGVKILEQSNLNPTTSTITFALPAVSTYTVSCQINTECQTSQTLTKQAVVNRTCVLPTGISTPVPDGSDPSKIQVSLTGSTADVATVTWEAKGNTTGNVSASNITNNGASATIKLNGNDTYTITASAKSACGTVSSLLSVTYTLQTISSASSFKSWRAGSNGNDTGNGIATDATGNVYVIGNYNSAIVFGSTNLSVSGTLGTNDVFIAKYNSNGDLAWVQRITGDNNLSMNEEGKSIAVDDNGNVYVIGQVSNNAGFFNSPADVRSGSPNIRRQPNGSGDAFVAKYDRDGQLQWSKLYGGGGPDQGVGLALHSSGLYITGFFSAPSATFGSTVIPASGIEGKYDIFIAKLNLTNGDALWAVSCGGFENDYASSIAADTDGNAYITGNFSAPADFRSFSGASTRYTANTTPDIFIAKYNTNGNLTAFHNSNSGTPAFGSSIAVSGSSVYITGIIQGSLYGNTSVTYRGQGDILIGKFSTGNLTLEWIRTAGGSGADAGNGIVADKSGNVYLTGLISDNCVFDNTTTVRSAGETDVFLAQYDTKGNFRFAKTAGGTGKDGGAALSINSNGSLLFLTGFYSSSFVFGAAPALIYSGGLDMFVAKFPD
ncbi:SBBP repeat-containing protein [Runella sp.]|uniref:SBBP repeat-containing protein n=1 Tax=Runella sp. TaxID=1960881 RepID=UPI00301B033F